jgi:hypothetical protein
MDQRPDLQLREQFFFQKKYYATPFTREEKQFLTRFYFRSPLLLAKSNPNPAKPPKIIFLLDDKQMSKPGNRLITAFITDSKLFEPVLDPLVLQTEGVSFKEWKTVYCTRRSIVYILVQLYCLSTKISISWFPTLQCQLASLIW